MLQAVPQPDPGFLQPRDEGGVAPPAYDEELAEALRTLRTRLEKAEEIVRRSDVREARERREFWNGNHWTYWSERDQTWKIPTTPLRTEESSNQDIPLAYYVNDYLTKGLDTISLLTRGRATTKFYPGNPNHPEDVTAAEAATDYIRYFRRENRDEVQRFMQGYYLWNDGSFFCYVRPQADADRFGQSEEPIIKAVPTKLGEDSYRCAACGNTTPASGSMGMCAACGAETDDSMLQPAAVIEWPTPVGTETIPNAGIVMDTYGKLEVRTPSTAFEVRHMAYLDLQLETPRSQMRALYPNLSEKIGLGAGASGLDNTYEINARRTIMEGTGSSSQRVSEGLVTYSRTWFAPWAFWEEERPEIRKRLLKEYPNGAVLILADDTICEVRAEALKDRWRVCHAIPSTGQTRPSLGSPQLPIQKAKNDLLNSFIDSALNGASLIFADSEAIDADAIGDTRRGAGYIYPIRRRPGEPLSALWGATPQATVPEQAVRLYEHLTEAETDQTTGIVPALVGAQTGGAGNTASGYAQMNRNAMNRIGMSWARMRYCNEEVDELAFQQFRETAQDDLTFTEPGEGGESELREIHVDELSGEVRIIHDTSEEIPASPIEEKALLTTLLQMAPTNPAIAAVLALPANMEFIKSRLAVKDLEFPMENPIERQLTEIDQLLKSPPQVGVGLDGLPVPIASSIPVNVDMDNHPIHSATILEWWETREAEEARRTNPQGVANVILHYQEHENAGLMKAQKEQAKAAMLAPPPPQPNEPGPPQAQE